MNSAEDQQPQRSNSDSWNAVPGLQTAPTVLSGNAQQQYTGHISSWSARHATPLAPPASSTIDWSSSSNDWSSRSANAATRANKPVTPVIVDTWKSSSQTPTTNTETAGWGPAPAAPAGNGWGAAPVVPSAVASTPIASSDGWGPANPPVAPLSGGGWAPSFPGTSSTAVVGRRSSFNNEDMSSSGFGNIHRRPSELSLRSGPIMAATNGWGSPSITTPATSSTCGWGSVPGISTASSATPPTTDGWGNVQGSSRSLSTPQVASSGWSATSSPAGAIVSLASSPQNATSNWSTSSAAAPSKGDGWGSQRSAPTPAPAKEGWGGVPTISTSTSVAKDEWGVSTPRAASSRPVKDGWDVATPTTASPVPVKDGWHSGAAAAESVASSKGASTESAFTAPPANDASLSEAAPAKVGWDSRTASSSPDAAPAKDGFSTVSGATTMTSPLTVTGDDSGAVSGAPTAQKASGWDSASKTTTFTLNNKVSSQSLSGAGGWGQSAPATSPTSASVNNWCNESTQPQTTTAADWGSAAASKEVPQAIGWNSIPGVSSNPVNEDARPSVGGWSSPSPVGSQSNGWSASSAIPSSQSNNNGWNSPAAASTAQSSTAPCLSRKDSFPSGWGPSPAASPVTTTGWNSAANATAGPPARPSKGTGGIGAWNPQTFTSAQARPVVGAPRGPPANGMGGWGSGVGASCNNSEVEKDVSPTATNNIGVIGGGVRRTSSSSDFKREDSNTSIGGESVSSVNASRLFAKSFAEISVENPTSVKDELASAIGVYVFGLPAAFKIKEILAIFSEFGDIVNVGLTPMSLTNPRAYAFIEYEEAGSAAKAIRATHGKNVTASSDALEVVADFGTGIPPISGGAVAAVSGSAPASKSQPPQQQPQPVASTSVDSNDVERIFGRGAEIRFINIVPRPKERRNMVFVTFKNHAAAAKALFVAKTGRHFGMLDPLKVDFSKAETRSITANATGSSPSNSATVSGLASSSILGNQTAKKSEVSLSTTKVNDRKSVSEKKSTSSLTGSISGGSKKSAVRPSLYIRDIRDNETESSLRVTLNQVGAVVSCHIVTRLDGAARYGLVSFENGDDAARAVRDKVENAVYPRQRRLTVTKLPKGTTESHVTKAFQSCGEIKRVDFSNGNTTAELEFARGDGAIMAHIFIIEGKITLLPGLEGGYSLPSATATTSARGSIDDANTATTSADVSYFSSTGADDVSEHQQIEHLNGDVEVIRSLKSIGMCIAYYYCCFKLCVCGAKMVADHVNENGGIQQVQVVHVVPQQYGQQQQYGASQGPYGYPPTATGQYKPQQVAYGQEQFQQQQTVYVSPHHAPVTYATYDQPTGPTQQQQQAAYVSSNEYVTQPTQPSNAPPNYSPSK
ncbi:UNVERIFIED_CONTAM: hypothetical protein HDU68_009624 [Siphonaria sp. JEL0065]|nr:hypothetical protein HDU68_009624 [Siphonaria sp. JEL0065]